MEEGPEQKAERQRAAPVLKSKSERGWEEANDESLREALRTVVRAAAAGARSATQSGVVVQDAIDATVTQWQRTTLAGQLVKDAGAWAYRVGANAARRHLSRRRFVPLHLSESRATTEQLADAPKDVSREDLRDILAQQKAALRGRQYEVLIKMLEHEMTHRRAARELGMTPGNVRRSFRSAILRLRNARK